MTDKTQQQFANSYRILGQMVGCFRRQADCPQLVTRTSIRTWRWLCMPTF
jgi:hypothetical protein